MRPIPLLLLVLAGRAAGAVPDGVEFFEKKVRPVLLEHCVRCHGAEATKNKKLRGGLRLDTREGMRKGGDSGPAVVPGDARKSLLLASVRHDDGAEKMPPTGKLPAAVIADLVRWVEMGAPAPEDRASPPVAGIDWEAARRHWAYHPPVASPPPAVKDARWASASIDRFALAALEKRGLRPVQPAGRREFLRRATFGLLGLPPTPEEVAAFESDASPAAFARAVDRLLASPHYGERWGRYWLDVARYADDKALAFPTPWPHSHRYRDWVVKAFNDDMPYDEFLRLQLAGDLVPESAVPDAERRLSGLGFQGLGAEYHKGSVPAQVKADELDDRIDTLTRGLLGLTVACARCHDHKFDPVPTSDYYALAAAYNGASWSLVTLSPPAVVARHQAWDKQGKEIEGRIAKWNAEQKQAIVKGELESAGRYLTEAWRLRVMRKHGIAVREADHAAKHKLRPAILATCANLLAGSKKGTPLAAWQKAASEAEAGARADAVPPDSLVKATAEVQRLLSMPKRPPEGEALAKLLVAGPFAISPTELPGLLGPDARNRFDAMLAESQAHKKAAPPAPVMAHGVSGGGEKMRIAIRGNVERLGEPAAPGFLRILERGSPAARPRFTRLELAEAICSPKNPLTARVIVNRVWQHHFGRGIVATASNFGALGDRPTHPELLDSLAVRFVESGWSIKRLHRELLLSSTYRLGSEDDPRSAAIDPENALLWRHAPRRLDVESWRDAVLAVSGRLERSQGGAPAGLGEAGNVRRTLYGKVSRLEPDKMLVAFDFPDANVSSERRAVTVVPQQQLFVLNSDFMAASAKALAARLEQAAPKDEQRIALAHRLAFGRAATADETALGLAFLRAASLDARGGMTAWEQYAQAILASNEFTWVD